jgi:hypothetical protein
LPPCAECYLVHRKKRVDDCQVDLRNSCHGNDHPNNSKPIPIVQHFHGDSRAAAQLTDDNKSGQSDSFCDNKTTINASSLIRDEIPSNQQHISRVSSCLESTESGSMESVDDLRPLYKKCQDLCQHVADYLEEKPPEYFERFMVPPKFLRHFWVMDIVKPQSKNSCCFTKR